MYMHSQIERVGNKQALKAVNLRDLYVCPLFSALIRIEKGMCTRIESLRFAYSHPVDAKILYTIQITDIGQNVCRKDKSHL